MLSLSFATFLNIRYIFYFPQVDIKLVSETWFKPYISDKSVALHGYNVYRNDCTTKGSGGVDAYVRSLLKLLVRVP